MSLRVLAQEKDGPGQKGALVLLWRTSVPPVPPTGPRGPTTLGVTLKTKEHLSTLGLGKVERVRTGSGTGLGQRISGSPRLEAARCSGPCVSLCVRVSPHPLWSCPYFLSLARYPFPFLPKGSSGPKVLRESFGESPQGYRGKCFYFDRVCTLGPCQQVPARRTPSLDDPHHGGETGYCLLCLGYRIRARGDGVYPFLEELQGVL